MTLKRLAAPRFWRIERKTEKFVVTPTPGPHPAGECLPLGVAIRDMLGYAQNMKEAKHILNAGFVKVDGVVRKEGGFPLGLMDVLSIGDEHYRITPDRRGLRLLKIDEREAGLKLLRIEKKTAVGKGKIQLNFHDGKNLLVGKDQYKTGDVVVFDVEKKAIKEALKLEEGASALVIGGNNVGSLCRVEQVIVTRSSMPNQVAVDLAGRKITLPKYYVFVVGRGAPAVKIGDEQ